MKKEIKQLHTVIIDLMGLMNRPQQDIALIKEADITLDRALFPLLVMIERRGEIGVKELADMVGRDYTTVSRQVAKLESLKLVQRQSGKSDRRVNQAIVTEKGLSVIESLNKARERLAASVLSHWDKQELEELVRLLRKFTDDLQNWRN